MLTPEGLANCVREELAERKPPIVRELRGCRGHSIGLLVHRQTKDFFHQIPMRFISTIIIRKLSILWPILFRIPVQTLSRFET